MWDPPGAGPGADIREREGESMALGADALRGRVPAAVRMAGRTSVLAARRPEKAQAPPLASTLSLVQAGGAANPAAAEYENLLVQLHWLLLNLSPTPAPGASGQVPTPPVRAPVPQPEPEPESGPEPEPVPAPKPEDKPAPAPAGERRGSGPLLRMGSDGPAVEELQRRLKELGFDPGPVDGAFGPKTHAAVKAFQRSERIEVDGIVGPQTWKHLGITVEKPRPPENVGSADALRKVTPQQLAAWGANDKDAFFAALKPAAVEAERQYGVPWQVTLVQAALESGWGKSALGGYNIFGIKGTGPAGSVSVPTKEYVNGRYITITAKFAKYHDFHEAVVAHGKLFHNGYYDKAVNQFAKDHDPVAFARNIHGIYATDPSYASKLISLMQQYDLI